MAVFQLSCPAPKNRLLAALPAEDLARIGLRLEAVEFGLRDVIQVPDKPITAVYFPGSGWFSMLALMVDGSAAEIGIVCVHRLGVMVAARLFQQAGLIRYGNGQMTITDRAGLEAAACECHGVVAREFQRLLGAAPNSDRQPELRLADEH